MPTVAGKFLRAMICLALAAFLYQTAKNVSTVEVVVIAGGEVTTVAVDDDDPKYQTEIEAAKRKAIALYFVVGVMLLACLNYLRSAVRLHKAAKRRMASDY